MPIPNQKLVPPIMDVSTKLEITDRYLTWAEAQQISMLSNNEIKELKNLTNMVNDFITREFLKIGLVNEDGKIEVGFNLKRHLMLVDVLGTLDECRFTFDGLPVSKEIARIYYRNSEWYQAVEEAKKKDRQNWKKICRLNPEPLPPRLNLLISQIYCAVTNEITENEWFKNLPSLKNILNEIKEILLERNIVL
jgi:phosphoribosylaminoimidazole-succinocarboxamide synthase